MAKKTENTETLS